MFGRNVRTGVFGLLKTRNFTAMLVANDQSKEMLQYCSTGGKQELCTDGKQELCTGGKQELCTDGKQELCTDGKQELCTDGKQELCTGGKQELCTGGRQELCTDGKEELCTGGKQELCTDGKQNSVVVFVAVITLIVLEATEKELASSRRHLSDTRRLFVSGALFLCVDLCWRRCK